MSLQEWSIKMEQPVEPVVSFELPYSIAAGLLIMLGETSEAARLDIFTKTQKRPSNNVNTQLLKGCKETHANIAHELGLFYVKASEAMGAKP